MFKAANRRVSPLVETISIASYSRGDRDRESGRSRDRSRDRDLDRARDSESTRGVHVRGDRHSADRELGTLLSERRIRLCEYVQAGLSVHMPHASHV